MYRDGRGLSPVAAEAVRWLHLAADQGNALAQLDLGVMLAGGAVVPADPVIAHLWLGLAAARLTGEEGDRAVAARDAIAADMTSAQRAESERRDRAWRPVTER